VVRGDYRRLARELEQAITAAGLSSAEAGRQGEISDATMRRYLASDTVPDRHTAHRLATVLANDLVALRRPAINLSLGAQLLAFSEGLLLAERGGIDRETAIEVMNGSPIGSPMLRARRDLLLNPPADAWFGVGLMQKDIRLALRTADAFGVPLPSAHVTDDVLTRACELGYGHRDIASMLEVLQRTPAGRVRP
jgi:hypothetical protein